MASSGVVHRASAVLIPIKADEDGLDNLHAAPVEPDPQAVAPDQPPPICKDLA